jgi:hypothetical protein
MRALIIGGDHIEPTRRALRAQGYEDIVHWSGRKTGDLTRPLPARVGHMVIVLDYVNHNLARRMRQLAREHRIHVDYVGRKGSH